MARPPVHLTSAKAVLADRGEMKAGPLSEAIGVSPATLLSGIKAAILRGEILKRNEGRAVFYRLPGQEPGGEDADEVSKEFNAALWADGDLVLVGVTLNADGNSVTLGPKQAHQLRRLLAGGVVA
jgi:hypothetical protein